MDDERRNSEGSTSFFPVDSPLWMAAQQQQQKRQRCQVVQMNENVISDSELEIVESQSNHKDKQIMEYDVELPIKVTFNLVGSSTSNAQYADLVMENCDYEDDHDDYNYDEEDYDYSYDPADDFNQYLADKFDDMDLPTGVEAFVPWLQKQTTEEKTTELGDFRTNKEIDDEIQKKYKSFKQFDTVEDYSDHHFAKVNAEEKTRKDWAKRVQNDWKILEKDLPETIFVRVYEDRMDLLRAAIVGPCGTPYHDGLFFFDAQFPVDYPNSPPKVHYHSGGLRLNPNLYNCGKVCLSLLGTWSGSGCERWNKTTSTMLQVLVSIQALVLNEKPYFNEPGYESSANTAHGQRNSLEYNENAFVLSCKTMLYSLRKPPKHFEDLIAGHFRERGRTILLACKAYLGGIIVGSPIPDENEDKEDEGEKRVGPSAARAGQSHFKANVQHLFEELLMEFSVKGADVGKFLAEKVKQHTVAAGAAGVVCS